MYARMLQLGRCCQDPHAARACTGARLCSDVFCAAPALLSSYGFSPQTHRIDPPLFRAILQPLAQAHSTGQQAQRGQGKGKH